MEFTIRQMTLPDYEDAYSLWSKTEGIDLDEEDDYEAIEIYLNRNHGLCFVATINENLIGTLLCGHEGRRGLMRHLCVATEFRNKGIAKALISKCLKALAGAGIRKGNTFVLKSNIQGRHFWEHMGFHYHEDNFRLMQIPTKSDE
jgi:ribosomal protein S18 acetylase RimI-like enzyme